MDIKVSLEVVQVSQRLANALKMLYRDLDLKTANKFVNKPVQFIECHGTGTKVGDVTETAALTNVIKSNKLGMFKKSTFPISIGSIKAILVTLKVQAGSWFLLKC